MQQREIVSAAYGHPPGQDEDAAKTPRYRKPRKILKGKELAAMRFKLRQALAFPKRSHQRGAIVRSVAREFNTVESTMYRQLKKLHRSPASATKPEPGIPTLETTTIRRNSLAVRLTVDTVQVQLSGPAQNVARLVQRLLGVK